MASWKPSLGYRTVWKPLVWLTSYESINKFLFSVTSVLGRHERTSWGNKQEKGREQEAASQPASEATASVAEHGLALPSAALSGPTHQLSTIPALPSCASAGFTSARQPVTLQCHFRGQGTEKSVWCHWVGGETDSRGESESLPECYLPLCRRGWWILVCLWVQQKHHACHWQKACQMDQWWGVAAAAAVLDMLRFNLPRLSGWG